MEPTDFLTPCSNFSMIAPGVYRSGYPSKKNFSFLKTLGIKSICYLCPEEYALVNQSFYKENDIQIYQFPMEGNKEPFVNIPEEQVNGKHRTGAVCGCLRKVQGWSLVSIIDEYNRFAGDKSRAMDQQFVEIFRPALTLCEPCVPDWLSVASVNPLHVRQVLLEAAPMPEPTINTDRSKEYTAEGKKQRAEDIASVTHVPKPVARNCVQFLVPTVIMGKAPSRAAMPA
eukprot:gene1955-2970_t